MREKSLTTVAADIRENDWLEKLQLSGNTVWVLEGIINYLLETHAMQVLQPIADNCTLVHTVLLADFMNKLTTTLSSSIFHFYSDWPEPDHLLPSLRFSHVKLSQIGGPDAHFGLMHDPLNLFNKLRSLPRSVQINPEQMMEHHAVDCIWCRLLVHRIKQLHRGAICCNEEPRHWLPITG